MPLQLRLSLLTRMAHPEIPSIRMPIMFQNWRHLTFLHWRAPVPAVSGLLPSSLGVNTYDGSDWVGIWFFSLDAARWPDVLGVRVGYGLAYSWSRARVTVESHRVRYESRGVCCVRAASSIEIEAGERVEASEIEIFLTVRFRLYYLGKLACAEVEHEPWPLHSARSLFCEQRLTQEAGIHVEAVGSLVHYSPGVKVRVGCPKLVSVGNSTPN